MRSSLDQLRQLQQSQKRSGGRLELKSLDYYRNVETPFTYACYLTLKMHASLSQPNG